MTSAKIGVVVPVFNRAQTVLHTLESILQQTRRVDSLAIVDDGSSDRSSEVIQRWIMLQNVIPQVAFRSQPNSGAAEARNLGLSLVADCEYVAFLDSDDVWPVEFLEASEFSLASQPKAVAATCDRLSIAPDGSSRLDDLSRLSSCPVSWMLINGAGVASCSLLRNQAVRAIGGFPSQMRSGEDTLMFLRLSQLGDWLHVPGPRVTFNRERPCKLGEAAALSSLYQDNARRWARVYEQFFLNEGVEYLCRRNVRDGLALAWYRAGRELMRNGLSDEARDCFAHSLRWNSWKVKTWLKLARTATATRAVA